MLKYNSFSIEMKLER